MLLFAWTFTSIGPSVQLSYYKGFTRSLIVQISQILNEHPDADMKPAFNEATGAMREHSAPTSTVVKLNTALSELAKSKDEPTNESP